MNSTITGLFFTLLLIFSFQGNTEEAHSEKSSDAFFNQLSQFCSKTLSGKTIYPEDLNDPFVGVELVINFNYCDKNEIRAPFKVGEDTSRTWFISKTENGLLLKHDHRHKDGTPDEITMYGGYSDDQGSHLQQNFHADEHTALLIPAAKTNIWSLTIDKESKTLTYYLQRDSKKRYKAVFDFPKE